MGFFLACAADSENPGLYSVVHLPPKSPAYDLLSKMLEYVVPFEFMGILCMLYAYNNYNEANFQSSSCIYCMHIMITMRQLFKATFIR